ncbi:MULTISPECIES: hypothetical protein [unclassified Caulobacter]|jgi:hypothetical protein|uniref:hypothetical protein n=1 Tax=unclassified Caulobacter TaxID=2648921 RepID=UPI0007817939|nr:MULTISPECIES: hypothetical protein [unclassified Caulobacter]AZS22807.1 hypothetical protein CSW63_20570 [Caulobacter sp. FWC26]
MDRNAVLRLAGLAAIVGGLIDLFGPLVYPHMAQQPKLITYVLIDVLLLLGLFGLLSATWRSTGWLGLAGFVVAVTGVLLVRSSATNVLGPSTDAIAAAVWAIGMAIIGVAQLRPRTPFRLAGCLWMLTVIIPLVAMLFQDHRASRSATAHALFALGFMVAGAQLVRRPQSISGDPA